MKVGLLGFTTSNLGDDMQSIATALNLPYVDRFVLRDGLSRLKLDERHFCIMQSWFSGEKWWAPSSAIDPLFFGFCFGREGMRMGQWPSYLVRHQPIGARDLSSMNRLANVKAGSYWTGCLTLRAGSFFRPVPPEERSGVYMVDVRPEVEHLVPKTIRDRAVRISNEMPPGIHDDPIARFSYMSSVCDTLRRAELVVTRRLHTALPCVGFRTPVAVIIAEGKGNNHRFSGFDRFVPVHYYKDTSEVGPASGIDWNKLGPVDIAEELDERYAELRARIADRLGAVGDSQYDNVYQRHTLRIPNPGLGPESGRVMIDLGMTKVERAPFSWTDREVVVTFDSFASFERFRAPVLLQKHGEREWVRAGTVAELVEGVEVPR